MNGRPGLSIATLESHVTLRTLLYLQSAHLSAKSASLFSKTEVSMRELWRMIDGQSPHRQTSYVGRAHGFGQGVAVLHSM